MSEKRLDTSILDKAIKFAVDAHSGFERRGKNFPYIVHPMEAVSIVATITNDQELLASAALHDTVEDTDTTIGQIEELFGPRVASLVYSESDENVEEEWKPRKTKSIRKLSQSSRDAKIVAMGDKLSNMRAIARDYRVQGDKLWTIFHAPGGKADHKWHYEELAKALCDLEGTEAYDEFVKLIKTVFD